MSPAVLHKFEPLTPRLEHHDLSYSGQGPLWQTNWSLHVVLELPLPIPGELQGYLIPIGPFGVGAEITDGTLNERLVPSLDDKVMPKKRKALWQGDIRRQPTGCTNREVK